MAFDSDTRNKLARIVAQARQLLTDEFTHQLQEIYGIQPDGAIAAIEKLTHLDDEEAGTALLLRERIDHLASGMTTEKEPVVAAIDRTIREQAFTLLNRFAALRLCEERGFIEECIRNGFQSKGFQVYKRVAGAALGDTYERYKTFLFCLFDEIAFDLGMLFDRFSPQGLLFPREQALLDFFAVINNNDLGNIWTEDETIGWIYQYFNPSEERRAMRAASQAPRNSRELAVRNQFFTPRYVVEFLTDNTLGRIWYEMSKGETVLKEECRYLVRRPNEVFLSKDEKAPPAEENDLGLSQEELLKKPVYIDHRPKKDPRDLKVLDPACGSGHFLLYAFDLLERIYEEAWEDTESPKSDASGHTLQDDYENFNDLRLAIPKLIMDNNLHGIDIDPRAVQIAALALWLRAQKSWKNIGLKAAERPQISKSNIVTAEPMPGEENMRREFIEGLKPRVLGQLVEVAFDKMNLAGEAGSLLKIEEEIQDGIREAKEQWISESKRAKDKKGNELLFSQAEMDRIGGKVATQKKLFDVSDITDEDFWNQAEDRILGALKDYSEQIDNGRAVRRRLFADDAARGFAFLDLCRKRYDVVLMNPPFGDSPRRVLPYLKAKYFGGRPDAYMCFVKRSEELLKNNGFTGAITSRTFQNLEFFLPMRRLLLEGRLLLDKMADLSGGVLDGSTVETCAYTVHKIDSSPACLDAVFLNLSHAKNRNVHLIELVDSINAGKGHADIAIRPLNWFTYIPGMVLCYSLHSKAFKSFVEFPPLDTSSSWIQTARNGSPKASVKQGLIPGDLFRFARLRAEVPVENLMKQHWIPICRGGDFHKFYYSEDSLFSWRQEGKEAKAYAEHRYGGASRTIKNIQHFGKRGFTYPRISSIGFNVRVMPGGFAFSDAGLAIIPADYQNRQWLLGFLNSRLCDYFANSLHPGRKFEIAHISSVPLNTKLRHRPALTHLSLKCVEKAQLFDSLDELSLLFTKPTLCLGVSESLISAWQHISHSLAEELKSYGQAIEALNKEVFDAYGFDSTEIEELNELYKASGRPKEKPSGSNLLYKIRRAMELWPEAVKLFENILEGELPEFTRSFVSYTIGCIFGRWDVRICQDPSLAPNLPDPFEPPSVSSPGILLGSDGLPAKPKDIISEEWMRVRPDANTLPPEGSIYNPTLSHEEYPLRISWDGILVDDSDFNGGQQHQGDIVARVREVLDLFWKDKAHEIEQEACEILGVSDLHDYFRKSSGFFQDHLKRYSKSRRKAPIYWPISTSSGSYTLWIYYHRLTDQTLYACINDYLNPKLDDIAKDVGRLQEQVAKQSTAQSRQKLEQLVDFEPELKDFRDELLRIAALPYKPNLNDGVLITASPLWKLFRHNQWRKDLKACWGKLEAGEYDWAHLAYTLWPDRVKENCKKDLSIAIAHDLKDLYEGEINKTKKRGKKSLE